MQKVQVVGWARRAAASVVAIALAVGVVLVPVAAPSDGTADAAAAPAGLFLRGAGGITLGGQGTVYAKVVTDGKGTFHSVTRINSVLGQWIQYRRSTDAGRTWTLGGFFSGPDGGATRPTIAVSGDNVAIGFIGAKCASLNICTEVPMLVTSTTGGRGWNSPMMLSSQWGDEVTVAVEDNLTWVAWERGNANAVAVRLVRNGTEVTPLPDLAGWSSPQVEAEGSFALFAGSSLGGTKIVAASAPEGLGPVASVPGALQDVALADRRGHVMVRTDGAMNVYSFEVFIGVTVVPGQPVAVGSGAVWSGRMDARRGLVVATWTATTRVGTVSTAQAYASSSKDKGATFGSPMLIGDNPTNIDLFSEITIGQSVGDSPIATFDWSVAPKYVDGSDPDDLPEPANMIGEVGADQMEINRSAAVTLDGCRSIASPGRTISADAYQWAVDGTALDATGCRVTTSLTANHTYRVTLTITDSANQVGQTEIVVEPKDLLVVSIGDSIASGEGNPHLPASPAIRHSETWQDQACHRSAYAGPALAARQLEEADNHSSVTFVQLSCSGASIMDVPDVPGLVDPTDDLASGGLLDSYSGVEPLPTDAPLADSARPPQMDQLDTLRGNRAVDVLMVSIGANDVRFSELVKECLTTAPGEFKGCDQSSTKSVYDQRLAEMPGRYSQLAQRITQSGIDPSKVYITEYFDQTTDSYGQPNMRCVAEEALDVIAGLTAEIGLFVEFLVGVFVHGGLITDDEARFAHDYVGPKLNAQVATAAAAHGWHYVGGIAAQFFKHGYCADLLTDPWVVQLGESIGTQHDEFGSFHPNRAGHEVYGKQLFASIRTDLVAADATPVDTTLRGDAIGDVYALVQTNQRLVAIALRDGGDALIPVGAKMLSSVDTSIDPNAMVAVTSPIAASGMDAVAVWNEGWQGWGFYQTAAAPVALVDNVTVRNSRVVQAPINSTQLLKGREFVVSAGVDAHVGEAVNARVHTVVTDDTGTLFDRTETVRIEPGLQTLVLPASGPLTSAGAIVDATVTIEPVNGEPFALQADNSATAPTATNQVGRAMKLTVVPTDTESLGSVNCAQAAQSAARMTAFTEGVLPVMELQREVSCTPPATLPSGELGIYQALLELDEYAQLTGRDVVVGVVPDGWLQANAGGAVGISAAGVRAMLVERSADQSTMAHEFAHTWGIDHINDAPAGGVWVARRAAQNGQDLMNERVVPKPWVGKSTWERLLVSLGGPDNEPQLPDFTTTGVTWVRGAVAPAPGGGFEYRPGHWQSPNPVNYVSPRDDLSELEVERLMAVQVDTDTGASTTTPVGLATPGGLFGPNGGTPLTGRAFTQRLVLDPGVDRIDMVLDGTVVESRAVSANAPTITVTAPVTGTVVGSNENLVITWDAQDADGDALTYTVLISPDGGTTWRPVAADLTSTSLSIPSPEDIDSQDVVIRVLASDGVRTGYDDSDTIGVLAAILSDPPRVVFVEHQRVDAPNTYYPTIDQFRTLGQPGTGLFTMAPDGTDVQPLVPYTLPLDGSPHSPLRPFWNPGATKVTFDAMTANGTRQLFVINRDGTGLRQLTNTDSLLCSSWHPDGTKLLATDTFDGSLRVIDASTGALLANLGESKVREWDERAGCPKWSPDGTKIALMRDGDNTRGALALADATTGFTLRYEDSFFGGYVPMWSPDGTRVAAQGIAPCVGFIVRDGSTLDPRGGFGGYSEQNAQTCMPSMGFVSNTELWFTTNYNPWPVNYTNVSCSFFCTFSPAQEPVGRFCTAPLQPSGSIATCYLPDNSGVAVSAASTTPSVGVFQADFYPGVTDQQQGTGPIVIPPPATVAADAGGPYAGVVGQALQFDAGASTALLGDGASSSVTWDMDGDGAFDDAAGVAPEFGYDAVGTFQVKVRITPPVGDPVTSSAVDAVISAPPAVDPVVVTDPDPTAPVDPAAMADMDVTIPANASSSVQLQRSDGSTERFEVDGSNLYEGFGMAVPFQADPWLGTVTLEDGVVELTPPTGYLGTTQLRFRPVGATDWSLVTVHVVGNRPPVVGADRVTATPGSVTVIDPAVLLANDTDPDPTPRALRAVLPALAGGLTVANVVSGTNTDAWMDGDGMIHVRLTGATGAFAYVAADAGGAVALGAVTVVAGAVPTTTTAAPTTTVRPAPSTTVGDGGPTTTAFDGGLPVTGSDSLGLLRAAFWVALLGAGVVLVTRRRRPVR